MDGVDWRAVGWTVLITVIVFVCYGVYVQASAEGEDDAER